MPHMRGSNKLYESEMNCFQLKKRRNGRRIGAVGDGKETDSLRKNMYEVFPM